MVCQEVVLCEAGNKTTPLFRPTTEKVTSLLSEAAEIISGWLAAAPRVKFCTWPAWIWPSTRPEVAPVAKLTRTPPGKPAGGVVGVGGGSVAVGGRAVASAVGEARGVCAPSVMATVVATSPGEMVAALPDTPQAMINAEASTSAASGLISLTNILFMVPPFEQPIVALCIQAVMHPGPDSNQILRRAHSSSAACQPRMDSLLLDHQDVVRLINSPYALLAPGGAVPLRFSLPNTAGNPKGRKEREPAFEHGCVRWVIK